MQEISEVIPYIIFWSAVFLIIFVCIPFRHNRTSVTPLKSITTINEKYISFSSTPSTGDKHFAYSDGNDEIHLYQSGNLSHSTASTANVLVGLLFAVIGAIILIHYSATPSEIKSKKALELIGAGLFSFIIGGLSIRNVVIENVSIKNYTFMGDIININGYTVTEKCAKCKNTFEYKLGESPNCPHCTRYTYKN